MLRARDRKKRADSVLRAVGLFPTPELSDTAHTSVHPTDQRTGNRGGPGAYTRRCGTWSAPSSNAVMEATHI